LKKCGKKPILLGFSAKVLDVWFFSAERNDYCSVFSAAHTMSAASK
jgi:hypothetical protein